MSSLYGSLVEEQQFRMNVGLEELTEDRIQFWININKNVLEESYLLLLLSLLLLLLLFYGCSKYIHIIFFKQQQWKGFTRVQLLKHVAATTRLRVQIRVIPVFVRCDISLGCRLSVSEYHDTFGFGHT